MFVTSHFLIVKLQQGSLLKQTIHRAVQRRAQLHSKGSLDFALLSWELLSKLFRLLPLKNSD